MSHCVALPDEVGRAPRQLDVRRCRFLAERRQSSPRRYYVSTFRWVEGRSAICPPAGVGRRFGWGGLPATSLAAYAPALSCLQALSGGSIEPAACRDE